MATLERLLKIIVKPAHVSVFSYTIWLGGWDIGHITQCGSTVYIGIATFLHSYCTVFVFGWLGGRDIGHKTGCINLCPDSHIVYIDIEPSGIIINNGNSIRKYTSLVIPCKPKVSRSDLKVCPYLFYNYSILKQVQFIVYQSIVIEK